MRKIADIPIFFIIGRPRTGTSLIRMLFDAHPNVNIPIEGQFIIDLYPKYGHTKNWTAKKLDAFLRDLHQVLFFEKWTIDQEKLKKRLMDVKGRTTYAEVCKIVIFTYRSFFDKNTVLLLGDKNPGYTIYTEQLLRIFPEAKFIFINRDYRDNFLSLKRVDFELPFISLVTYKWKYFYTSYMRAREKHPERYYYIRYEDLAAEPISEFSKICSFLGIKPVDSIFDFHTKKHSIKTIYSEEEINKYHSSLFKPISTANINLWKNKLPEQGIKTADFVAGKYAMQSGYERKYTGTDLKTIFLALPGILGGRILYFATDVVNRFPYKLRQLILSKGPLFVGQLYAKAFKKNN